MTGLLPWHHAQWQRLVALWEQRRLPHALLLRGPRGVGKEHFARRVANALVCEQPAADRAPCATCRRCRLFRAGSHPDSLDITPDEERKGIVVDQIRRLIEQVFLTRHYRRGKVVTIRPAEAMTRPAVNTLLKTLEEPPAHTVFLLLSHASALLPATLRSRCQMIDFPIPPQAQAIGWLEGELGPDTPAERLLEAAGGAPLAAFAWRDQSLLDARAAVQRDLVELANGTGDPLAAAARWKGSLGAARLVALVLALVPRLARTKLAARAGQGPQSPKSLHELAQRLEFTVLCSIFDRCMLTRRAMEDGSTVNEQLLLERLAIAWTPGRRPDDTAGGMPSL